MSAHTLHANAHSVHIDDSTMVSLIRCRPGIEIDVAYHPGHEDAALAALDAAYKDVRAQIAGSRQTESTSPA